MQRPSLFVTGAGLCVLGALVIGSAARWSARPLGELLDDIQVQMPLHSPGGLTRRQNADILAFMLQKSAAAPGQKDQHHGS